MLKYALLISGIRPRMPSYVRYMLRYALLISGKAKDALFISGTGQGCPLISGISEEGWSLVSGIRPRMPSLYPVWPKMVLFINPV